MDLTCQDVKLLLLYLCYIELCIVQLFISSNDSRVIESIEALYVPIVFLNSLKFASRESRCLAASTLEARYVTSRRYCIFQIFTFQEIF